MSNRGCTRLGRFISLFNPRYRFRKNSEWLQQQLSLGALSKDEYYSFFDKVYLFRAVSYAFLDELALGMKVEYFPPKEDVILQNEEPTAFYFIVTGAVDIIKKKNGVEQVVGSLTRGDVCGETGVVCNRPQLYTVRTKRRSQLLRLNRGVLLNIVQYFITDGTIIVENLLEHLKKSEKPEMREVSRDIEKMLAECKLDVDKILAECKMELPLSLCFAATRGDHFLLHQFLKRGFNPNELDSNGRAPMHISASIGNEECVRLLLENKADPNIRDSEGFVPLWDALVGNHERVVNLLVLEKADLSKGDVKQFARAAIRKNNLNMLKSVFFHGGDNVNIRVLDISLWIPIFNRNTEFVEFLLKKGLDIDRPDELGWSARFWADYLGREEIKSLLKNVKRNDHSRSADVLIPLPNKVVVSYFHSRRPRIGDPYNHYLVGLITSANRRYCAN